MKNIKKFFAILLCLAFILTAASCGKKKDDTNADASISNIPTASADDDKQSQENSDKDNENTDNSASGESEAGDKSASSDKQDNTRNQQEALNKERTPKTDNAEIESNIRDAQELIDDAKELIKVLRSRNLTEAQEKRVDKLESQLISISD